MWRRTGTRPAGPTKNGSVEQAHYRFKRAVEQALLLRGTREFADRASYEAFLREIFGARNKRRIARLGDDLRGMNELPPMRIEDFRRERVPVTRFSTIRAADNTYSVSSRLIGEVVDLRLYAETIEIWHGERLVATMEYGTSRSSDASRDASRIRGFPGSDERGDRGHLAAHAAGGGLDINVFHQDVYLNRGWSPEGKRYHQMERYCAENEGTFFFSRLIYADATARPAQIEFGILKADRTLWIELFENAGA